MSLYASVRLTSAVKFAISFKVSISSIDRKSSIDRDGSSLNFAFGPDPKPVVSSTSSSCWKMVSYSRKICAFTGNFTLNKGV